MEEERRAHKRVPLLVEVLWQGATGKYEARTSDISATGCFIDTIGRATMGETIRFKVRLPAGGWLELRGEVVYEQPGTGFGVLFFNIAEPNRKQLEWLVKAEAYRAEKQEPDF